MDDRLMRCLVACAAVVAACGKGSPPAPTTTSTSSTTTTTSIPAASATVTAMLAELPSYINWALMQNQSLLPNNPRYATQIQQKIAMLQKPTFAKEIGEGQFWSEGSAPSINGRTIPIASLFAESSMRDGAGAGVRSLEQALPRLETFMNIALPASVVKLWYGFILGNSGGGATLNMEDQATYEARTTPDRLPYEAILAHELSHTYVPHEGLNQFLELYVYNTARTDSESLQAWIYVRGYVPGQASNESIHALLDVYQLIGRDAMADAYRAVYGLRPPYGQPLSAACKQAFIDRAPSAVKDQVSEKMNRVIF